MIHRQTVRTEIPDWKRRTLLFLISQCITLFGSTLVQMAVVWYVTLRTSSGAWAAAFTVCSYLPQFLISFLGGVWADRSSKKLLIIGADASIAAVTLAMMLILPHFQPESVLLSALLVMSVIRSLGAGVQTPAVSGMLPQLVPREHLMRFNGINAAMQAVVQFAAPAAAGILLSAGTLRATLGVDVLTAALGIGLLCCVPIPGHKAARGDTSAFADLKTGIRYSLSEPLIGMLLLLYGFFIFLCVPAGFLAQLLVSRIYGNAYWYMTAVELAGFAGMTAGGLLMGTWGGFQSRVTTLRTGIAAFGILAAGMGLSRSFPLYLALMLLYGVALTAVQTAVTTLIQEKAQAEMQGRVFGLLGSMYSGFLPIGMAVFGPMADMIPLQWIMTASGAALVLIAAGTFCLPSFRGQ